MNYNKKLSSIITLSLILINMPLKAADPLEPLEAATQALKRHNSIVPNSEDLTPKKNISNLPPEDSHTLSSYTNLKNCLFYSTKILSGIASSILYEKYLSHRTALPKAFQKVLPFGAAVIGYTFPDVIESITGLSQKTTGDTEPFSEMFKRSIKNAATYASDYILNLSIDEVFAQIAYHGALFWTADPLLASASYQGAKNLIYYTGASHTFLKAAKDSGSRFFSNSFSSVKNWWYGIA